MSLERGKFGVEYFSRPRRNDSSGIGIVVVCVLALAAISLVATKFRDMRRAAAAPPPVAAPREAPSRRAAAAASAKPAAAEMFWEDGHVRPPRVRNLLLRLAEAEKTGNVDMAATTIESLRDLPGEPAADLDDRLARRLGELNLHRLFVRGHRQWVAEVDVRPRDTAQRLAASHGSTLASLLRLNNLKSADAVKPGMKLLVLNHPRFSLTVHRKARYADLNLNGKFFRRYDIPGDGEICAQGIYKTGEKTREFFASLGLAFNLRARAELETLLPAGVPVLVSDL